MQPEAAAKALDRPVRPLPPRQRARTALTRAPAGRQCGQRRLGGQALPAGGDAASAAAVMPCWRCARTLRGAITRTPRSAASRAAAVPSLPCRPAHKATRCYAATSPGHTARTIRPRLVASRLRHGNAQRAPAPRHRYGRRLRRYRPGAERRQAQRQRRARPRARFRRLRRALQPGRRPRRAGAAAAAVHAAGRADGPGQQRLLRAARARRLVRRPGCVAQRSATTPPQRECIPMGAHLGA